MRRATLCLLRDLEVEVTNGAVPRLKSWRSALGSEGVRPSTSASALPERIVRVMLRGLAA